MRALEAVVDYAVRVFAALSGIALGVGAAVLGVLAAIALVYAFVFGLI